MSPMVFWNNCKQTQRPTMYQITSCGTTYIFQIPCILQCKTCHGVLIQNGHHFADGFWNASSWTKSFVFWFKFHLKPNRQLVVSSSVGSVKVKSFPIYCQPIMIIMTARYTTQNMQIEYHQTYNIRRTLTHGFNKLGKDNYKTRGDVFKFLDSMRLVLEVWLHIP